AVLLEGGAEALTRLAVELAFAGDPMAMRLCIERILPPCRERSVKFALPPIESAADIAPAMKAVTAALAEGVITPGEEDVIQLALVASGCEKSDNCLICAGKPRGTTSDMNPTVVSSDRWLS